MMAKRTLLHLLNPGLYVMIWNTQARCVRSVGQSWRVARRHRAASTTPTTTPKSRRGAARSASKRRRCQSPPTSFLVERQVSIHLCSYSCVQSSHRKCSCDHASSTFFDHSPPLMQITPGHALVGFANASASSSRLWPRAYAAVPLVASRGFSSSRPRRDAAREAEKAALAEEQRRIYAQFRPVIDAFDAPIDMGVAYGSGVVKQANKSGVSRPARSSFQRQAADTSHHR